MVYARVLSDADSPPAWACATSNRVIALVEPRSTRSHAPDTAEQNLSVLPPLTVPFTAFSGPSDATQGVVPVAGRLRARLVPAPAAGPIATLSKAPAALNTRTPLAPDANVASVTSIFGVARSPTYTLMDDPTAVTRMR